MSGESCSMTKAEDEKLTSLAVTSESMGVAGEATHFTRHAWAAFLCGNDAQSDFVMSPAMLMSQAMALS